MARIRFLVDRIVQDEHRNTPQETRYAAGQILECDDHSARRWIERGVAVAVDEPAPPAAPRGKKE
jgi:hypothetical protein